MKLLWKPVRLAQHRLAVRKHLHHLQNDTPGLRSAKGFLVHRDTHI